MDHNQRRFQHQADHSPNHQRQWTQTTRFGGVWGVSRIVLTSLSIACCTIVLGISIALAANPAIKSYIIVWTAPQSGAALLWSGVELITAYLGKEGLRVIHPGAHAAVHLLLWLGFGVAVGLTAYILDFALVFIGSGDSDAYFEYYNNHYEEDGHGYYSEYYIRSMEALVALLAVLIIIHISLFARASLEMIKYGRMASAPRQADYPLEPLQLAQLSEKNDE
ncbi:hypothetical protein M434DRAFT_36604 [Hypoxylon sp. CO27-5]|nr:hypothetical protein M434DRAFT_36604 [Hypoxylon sp. CO27-5]